MCEAVDQYALQWTKREMVELSVLSSWKEMVKGQIEERISKLKQNFKQPTGKVLQNADVKDNTRKMSAKCLLILSVEMIFYFDGFANGQINIIS